MEEEITKQSDTNEEEKTLNFLKEYRDLCVKHQMQIFACGCCDSPYVAGLKEEKDKTKCSHDVCVFKDGVLLFTTSKEIIEIK